MRCFQCEIDSIDNLIESIDTIYKYSYNREKKGAPSMAKSYYSLGRGLSRAEAISHTGFQKSDRSASHYYKW